MSVRLKEVDDFIVPSQLCVNPNFVDPTATSTKAKAEAAADVSAKKKTAKISLALEFDDDMDLGGGAQSAPPVSLAPPPLALPPPPKKAQVSLSDCLACSGCVTSAEAVLVSRQGVDAFRAAIGQARRHAARGAAEEAGSVSEATQAKSSGREDDESAASKDDEFHEVVVSVSPESLASIAESFGSVSPTACFARLSAFMHVSERAEPHARTHACAHAFHARARVCARASMRGRVWGGREGGRGEREGLKGGSVGKRGQGKR